MTSAKVVFIGQVAQIAGVAAVVLGVVLSLHHGGAAALLIGGIAAFFVGKKLRGAVQGREDPGDLPFAGCVCAPHQRSIDCRATR